MKLDEIAKELMEIERDCREMASDLQYSRVDRNKYVYDYEMLYDALESIERTLMDLAEIREMPGEEIRRMGEILDKLYDFSNAVTTAIMDNCWSEGYIECHPIKGDYRKTLVEYCEEISEEIDLPYTCGNLIPHMEELTLPAVIDGFSNCVHAVAEYIAKLGKPIEGTKRSYSIDGSEEAIRLCKYWEKYVDEFWEDYAIGDREPLSCIALKDEVVIRVGSAEGHAMHVNLKEKELEYYDTDYIVWKPVEYFLEDLGHECDYWDSVLICKLRDVSDETLADIAYVAANVTSLDIRAMGMNKILGMKVRDRVLKVLDKKYFNEVEMEEIYDYFIHAFDRTKDEALMYIREEVRRT